MRSRGERTERGASALELSLVAPFFLALIFLVIQSALYFYASNVAVSAAREGVADVRLLNREEYERVGGEARIRAYVEEYVSAVGQTTFSLKGGSEGVAVDYRPQRVTVTVSGDALSLLGPLYDLSVTREASGEVERFEPDLGQ
ncbi:MAG: pilus assembly protein [Propionibacteriales bacterium]|nr:pilus assembly protein [Propionibacteriales bacterium]